MYYDEEYENYYEPTPADEIFTEAMSKLKDALKESVKTNIEYIQEENKRLKEENKSLRNKSYEVDNKERLLEQKEKDLEKTFYRSKFSEILKPLEENMEVWYPDYSYKKAKKCNLCNDDRKITFTSPQGNTLEQKCVCDTSYKVYIPKKTIIEVVDFGKSYDYSDSKFTFRPKYRNSNDDDRRWCNFDITEIIKVFDETMAEFYGTYDTAFKDKEECKKYCDWKNKKEYKYDTTPIEPKNYDDEFED